MECNVGMDILIVQFNGGVMFVVDVCVFFVKMVLFGLVVGVIVVCVIVVLVGFDSVIICDMGGILFDVFLIVGGEVLFFLQIVIDFGMVICQLMIEIMIIGVGGGLIVYVDVGGLLEVGFESVGFDFGLVCYGCGNICLMVIDVNFLFGCINVQCLIGGFLDEFDVEVLCWVIEMYVG